MGIASTGVSLKCSLGLRWISMLSNSWMDLVAKMPRPCCLFSFQMSHGQYLVL